MTILYSKDAAKVLTRVDAPTRQRILQAVQGIPHGDIRPLQGSERQYRLRVGSWRVLYSHTATDEVLVEMVSPRGDAYK